MPVYNHYYPDSNNQVNTAASSQRLLVEGPTIPVAVSLAQPHVDFLTKAGKPIPLPLGGLALIDSGATYCAVDESVVLQLGIPPYGSVKVHGVGGASDQLTYPASLSFPGTPIPPITFFDFYGAPLLPTGIIALIGRNVLRHFVLVYNGPGGHVSLSF